MDNKIYRRIDQDLYEYCPAVEVYAPVKPDDDLVERVVVLLQTLIEHDRVEIGRDNSQTTVTFRPGDLRRLRRPILRARWEVAES